MKLSHITPLLLAAGLAAASAAETAPGAAGHWEGKLQMDAQTELDMVIDLAPGPQEGWIGSLSFPKSTARDIPLEAITVEDATVRFAAHVPGMANFSATLAADRNELAGVAVNPQGEAPFQLKRNGAAAVKLPPPSSLLAPAFAGAWEGVLQAGEKTRRVGLKLSAAKDGAAAGTLSVIGERSQEFPITTVTIKDQELQLELRAISGTYRGTLGANGEITGEWAQGPNRLPLTFKLAPAKS